MQLGNFVLIKERVFAKYRPSKLFRKSFGKNLCTPNGFSDCIFLSKKNAWDQKIGPSAFNPQQISGKIYLFLKHVMQFFFKGCFLINCSEKTCSCLSKSEIVFGIRRKPITSKESEMLLLKLRNLFNAKMFSIYNLNFYCWVMKIVNSNAYQSKKNNSHCQ